MAFEELDLASRGRNCLRQTNVDARQVQIAGAALWKAEAGEQDQRDPDEEHETTILGLEESTQVDLRGQVTAVTMSELGREDQRQGEERDR